MLCTHGDVIEAVLEHLHEQGVPLKGAAASPRARPGCCTSWRATSAAAATSRRPTEPFVMALPEATSVDRLIAELARAPTSSTARP